MWSGFIQLSADQVAVTSTDVTLPPDQHSIALLVEALDLSLTLDLADEQHLNSNPESVAGIEITRRFPLHENSFFVRVTLRTIMDTSCEVVWTAPEGTILENTTLTAD